MKQDRAALARARCWRPGSATWFATSTLITSAPPLPLLLGAVPARRLALPLLTIALVALANGGCVGPQAVKLTRLPYNEAYHSTNSAQILLNIVRMRYAVSPEFMDLPSITSQFEAGGGGGYLGGLDGQGPGITSLGSGELIFRDSPTLSYQPKKGKQFGRALAKPLPVELTRLVLGTTNFAPFMLIACNDANDVRNAPQACALIPDGPADNVEFRALMDLISSLFQRDAMELAIDTVEVPTSDAIPIANIRGQNLIDAAKSDYVYRAQGEERLTLKHRQKALALKIRSHETDSADLREFAERLNLSPGLDAYRIRAELLDDEEEDFEALPNPLGEDTIYLNMRSTLEIMSFLSKGVRVPCEHLNSGEAPALRDAEGYPFDWTHVTEGFFSVRSSHKRPKHAEVAIQYRGYWFWIACDDVNSRATLTTLGLLLSLQESGEEETGPLLTLPVGG